MSTMTLNPPHDFDTRRIATVHELRPAPARREVTGAPRGSVRLTRRGRVVVLAVALLFVLVAGIFLGGGSFATQESGTPAPTEIVMVQEGDTLWGIAAAIAEDGDVRAVMSEIERLNALDSSVVELGQKLRVPLAE
ncbi:LysM peptidoglycan-binding domain-containing protein [Nocardioides solisilvae]|uniref:LysM peptidoglycan-binding domain-containing protein n=1 Tax=Nocardioides solisilvae TaxID=1542435 RepID=UPI001950335C|nr:LysM peptidoglycan-binding domain-containing protein [Nocardioides solisilvae]